MTLSQDQEMGRHWLSFLGGASVLALLTLYVISEGLVLDTAPVVGLLALVSVPLAVSGLRGMLRVRRRIRSGE